MPVAKAAAAPSVISGPRLMAGVRTPAPAAKLDLHRGDRADPSFGEKLAAAVGAGNLGEMERTGFSHRQ